MTVIIILLILLIFMFVFVKRISRIEKKLKHRHLRIISVIATVLIIIFTVTIIKLDKNLYYAGRSLLQFSHLLPFNIEPTRNYDFGSDFVLQKSDESLIGAGVQYKRSDLVVNKILKYGYNQEEVIALVNDATGKEFYVRCRRNKEDLSLDDVGVSVVTPNDSNIIKANYKWVEPYRASFRNIELLRDYFIIILFLLLFLLVYSLYRQYHFNGQNNMQ